MGTIATHDFEVANFWLLDGMGVGKFVSSSTFSVGGGDWNIHLYPDGWKTTEDEDGYASVFLNFLDGPPDTRVNYRLSLLDPHLVLREEEGRGKRRIKEIRVKCGTHTFESAGGAVGSHAFVKKAKLQEFLLVDFTIRCVLTVYKTHTDDTSAIVVPRSKLSQYYFAHLLEDMECADLTISVGGELFHAHKYVLAARSDVFRAQLFGNNGEDLHTKCIKIDDMEPSVFEGLRHFIYTDSLPHSYHGDETVVVQQLLVAADRYRLKRLRLMCEQQLCSWIDVQSVAATLNLAERYRCVPLKDACLRFIACQDVLSAVMETEGFKQLMASYPLFMKEILDRVTLSNTDSSSQDQN
ncbi:hypothetical protein EJB05_00556, partial [Eragrostis curvula]